MLYWIAKFTWLGPLLRVLWRPWARGRENVPKRGPAILASNHLSFCDSFFMPVMLRRRVTFLAKAEYFTSPGVKGWISKVFFSGVGAVPIDRTDASAAEAAINTGVRVLRGGNLLSMYPEGTRSPDGRLYRGKTGVARMVLRSGAPVVPCVMVNTAAIQPPGRPLPKLRPRPGVVFGAPLDFSRLVAESGGGDRARDRAVEREITDEIMRALEELSGQEYVDVYAASVKNAKAK